MDQNLSDLQDMLHPLLRKQDAYNSFALVIFHPEKLKIYPVSLPAVILAGLPFHLGGTLSQDYRRLYGF